MQQWLPPAGLIAVFMIRISCPGPLLDAPKLESSNRWTTRRPYRHPAAGGGTPHLQQSSPPGGFRKMLPKFSATLTMLSHGATTPPLCPSQFETSYRRPNFGHRTGSLRQIGADKSLPRTRFRVCIEAPGGSICRRPGSSVIFIQDAAEACAPAAAVTLQIRRAAVLL